MASRGQIGIAMIFGLAALGAAEGGWIRIPECPESGSANVSGDKLHCSLHGH